MQSTEQKTIAIYADGAVIDDMRQMAKLPDQPLTDEASRSY